MDEGNIFFSFLVFSSKKECVVCGFSPTVFVAWFLRVFFFSLQLLLLMPQSMRILVPGCRTSSSAKDCQETKDMRLRTVTKNVPGTVVVPGTRYTVSFVDVFYDLVSCSMFSLESITVPVHYGTRCYY